MKITLDIDCPRWMKTVAMVLVPVLASSVMGIALAAPKTFAAGETLTAAALNENFSALEAEIVAGSHPPSAFRAYRNAQLSIADDVAQNVKFDVEIFDDGNEYDPSTGRFTAKSAGTYLIQCGFLFASSANSLYGATIFRNGGEIDASSMWAAGAGPNMSVKPSVSQIEHLAVGDVVDCSVYQHTGAAQPLLIFDARNSFSAIRVD